MQHFLRSLGLKEVVTVNLGVDVKTFNPAKRDPLFERNLGIREGAIKLLYVGRLSKEKNIEFLLRLMKRLSPKRYHLLIVGDGPFRNKVKRFAMENPNVTYLGYLAEKEVLARIYASSDILLSPSLGETFGLTFLEAQACGCILVALDMALESQPFKEFLVRELSEEAFRRTIEIAGKSISKELREVISSQVRENFSWNRTFTTLLSYYKRLLEN